MIFVELSASRSITRGGFRRTAKSGDWSIFRPRITVCGQRLGRKMDLSPLRQGFAVLLAVGCHGVRIEIACSIVGGAASVTRRVRFVWLPESEGNTMGTFLFWLIWWLAIWTCIGAAAGKYRGRTVDGIVLGFFLGALGIIILFLIADCRPKCHACLKPVVPNATRCCHCGTDVVPQGLLPVRQLSGDTTRRVLLVVLSIVAIIFFLAFIQGISDFSSAEVGSNRRADCLFSMITCFALTAAALGGVAAVVISGTTKRDV